MPGGRGGRWSQAWLATHRCLSPPRTLHAPPTSTCRHTHNINTLAILLFTSTSTVYNCVLQQFLVNMKSKKFFNLEELFGNFVYFTQFRGFFHTIIEWLLETYDGFYTKKIYIKSTICSVVNNGQRFCKCNFNSFSFLPLSTSSRNIWGTNYIINTIYCKNRQSLQL